MSINGYTEADLLARILLRGPRHGWRRRAMRWVVVRDLFQVGSGTAITICKQFNLSPYEVI